MPRAPGSAASATIRSMARPLKRAVQKYLQDPLADEILPAAS